jgi:aryl-alcohol dehydrogenase-like predicted oxidoreductase
MSLEVAIHLGGMLSVTNPCGYRRRIRRPGRDDPLMGTGLPDRVSPLGLGLAALGRPAYINVGHGRDLGADTDVSVLEGRAHAVLDAAYGAGVRYLDTARGYGRAEEFLASWLESRGISPGDVTVGSKWGYVYTAGWRIDAESHEEKDLSVDNLRRQAAESRELLGDHLALYQIHSATLESGVLEEAAVRDELARLRGQGLRIGFTVTGPRQRETIERALEVGGFDTVQATWNLMERSAEPALAAAHDEGLGVIVKEALANGRLLEHVPDTVALAAVLAQPWADVVLSGAASLETLRSNLAAAELRLTPDLEDLTERPVAYWGRRSKLPWT